MTSFHELYEEVLKMCSFESMSAPLNEKLGAACSENEVSILIQKLEAMKDSDLEDDSGDLQDYYWRLRTSISDALAAAGAIAIDPLLIMLQSSNEASASCAARSLGKMKAENATGAILTKLGSVNSNSERLSYISALGDLGDQSVIEVLLPYLRRSGELNGGWLVRMTSCALGRLGDERVADVLGEVLTTDAEWFARLGAAEGLGLLGSARGVPYLRRALHDEDKRVIKAANESLEKVQAKHPGGLKDFLRLILRRGDARIDT